MFSHIMLGANDLEVSKGFYDAPLPPWAFGQAYLVTISISIGALPAF